jgi:hypothetical protein
VRPRQPRSPAPDAHGGGDRAPYRDVGPDQHKDADARRHLDSSAVTDRNPGASLDSDAVPDLDADAVRGSQQWRLRLMGEPQTIRWAGFDWITNERYGQVNPSKDNVWYDPDAVKLYDPGKAGEQQVLHLLARPNPKEFLVGGVRKVVPLGVGLLSCTTMFRYGYFEIVAKLPRGVGAFPAFWMWSFAEPYRELDIFEGYANSMGNYFRLVRWGWWDVVEALSSGPVHDKYERTVPFSLGSPSKNFYSYAVDWTRSGITIWYNGHRVRWYAGDVMPAEMNLVINNSVQMGTDPATVNSDFVVRSFSYRPM